MRPPTTPTAALLYVPTTSFGEYTKVHKRGIDGWTLENEANGSKIKQRLNNPSPPCDVKNSAPLKEQRAWKLREGQKESD